MKIFLGSNRDTIKLAYESFGIQKDKIRIGYITTASKGVENLDFIDKAKEIMRNEGYSFYEFDIEGKSKEEILEFFKDKNVIHIEGGSTFYLLKAIRETGFDEILKTLLNHGLCYLGTSAGALVMGPDIEIATWSGKERFGVEDLTGLNYAPFTLRVHYKDEMEQDTKEKMKTLKCPLRILRDGEGILVEDGKYSFKGERDEVQLS